MLCSTTILYSLVFWFIFCYLFSFCVFYWKVYGKIGHALSNFAQFFLKSIYTGRLSLIKQVIRQFNFLLCLFVFMILIAIAFRYVCLHLRVKY